MNIFFDVDSTLIARDGSLRPFVPQVFERLIAEGHRIYVWSGVGLRWEVVERHGLQSYISGVFVKPLYDHHNSLHLLGILVNPDFCVDDHAEIIGAFGGVTVWPYEEPDPLDREMERVYQMVRGLSKARLNGS